MGRYLAERVGDCDALVAIIGKSWLSSQNRQRLNDPNDFVRIEIEAALNRKVRVIPVLVDGAAMPKASQLPESLKGLARRQGTEVSAARFEADVEKLTRALVPILDERRQRDAAEAEAARQAEEERRSRKSAEIERAAREEEEKREPAELAQRRIAAKKTQRKRRQAELNAAEKVKNADAERRAEDEKTLMLASEAIQSESRRRSIEIARSKLLDAEAVAAKTLGGEGNAAQGASGAALGFTPGALTKITSVSNWRGAATVALAAAATAAGVPVAPLLAPLVIGKLARRPAADRANESNSPTDAALEGQAAATTGARLPSLTTPQAQYEMGNNYFNGRDPDELDYQRAIYWYRLAADQGYSDAQLRLGLIYENGRGVGKDYSQAKTWYLKAAAQGDESAQAALYRLKEK